MKNKSESEKEITLRLTLEELKARFPESTELDINKTAAAFGMQPQTIYNSLRKNAKYPFPVKGRKICGRWYWNIIKIAEYMAQ